MLSFSRFWVLEQVSVLSFSLFWVLEGDIIARVMFNRRLLEFSLLTLLLSSCDRLWQTDGCLRVLTLLRRLPSRLGCPGFGYLCLPDLFVEDEPCGLTRVVLLSLRENPAALVLFFFPEYLLLALKLLLLGLFFAPLSLLLCLLLISLPLLLSLPRLVFGISFKVRLSFLLVNIPTQLELSSFHLLLLLLFVLH